MDYNPKEPFQDLPPLPPSDFDTPEVLRHLVGASTAIARLDEAVKRLPDPTVLINTVPLLEAQASSEIENIVTTNDELFRADALKENAPATPATKEALRYRAALRIGDELLDHGHPLTAKLAQRVCASLRGFEVEVRDKPGTVIAHPRTREVIYTPPQGKDVIERHLSRWERFINDPGEVPPLIAMAMAHYQFEAIHPFSDGNGRTGRILNLLMLRDLGILRSPVLYLSGFIVRNKNLYYRRLNDVTRRGRWQEWIVFMLTAVEETSRWTYQLVDDIDHARSVVEDRIRSQFSTIPAYELANLLFTQPYIRVDDIVTAQLAQRQTGAKWLNQLADPDLLEKRKVGRVNLYVNASYIQLLFARELPAQLPD